MTAATQTTAVPWFGSNRTNAHRVGERLKGCRWVGVPFAGGMCELMHIDAPTIMVGDLHRQVINLANVLAHRVYGPQLIRALRRVPFCEPTLKAAQEFCASLVWWKPPDDFDPPMNPGAALEYFICAWMSRNGTAGTRSEFTASFSHRWGAGGGDSAGRFRNAARGLVAWRRIFERCTFVVMDVFDFLERTKDQPKHALYLDPPFPDVGGSYKHTFTVEHHRRLAERLTAFEHCRVLCRFYDHPLIRELYPEPAWHWERFNGRRQTNTPGPEVLLELTTDPTEGA
ncbi:MAG: hypothetical protein K2P78_14550 [Gemmataceae bacterium]|nr:hypothetical protein [Gemmataceae bacterium]